MNVSKIQMAPMDNRQKIKSQPAFGMKVTLDAGMLMDTVPPMVREEWAQQTVDEIIKAVQKLNLELPEKVISEVKEKYMEIESKPFFRSAWKKVLGEKAPYTEIETKAANITRKVIPDFDTVKYPLKLEKYDRDQLQVTTNGIVFAPRFISLVSRPYVSPTGLPMLISDGSFGLVKRIVDKSKLTKIEMTMDQMKTENAKLKKEEHFKKILKMGTIE